MKGQQAFGEVTHGQVFQGLYGWKLEPCQYSITNTWERGLGAHSPVEGDFEDFWGVTKTGDVTQLLKVMPKDVFRV